MKKKKKKTPQATFKRKMIPLKYISKQQAGIDILTALFAAFCFLLCDCVSGKVLMMVGIYDLLQYQFFFLSPTLQLFSAKWYFWSVESTCTKPQK